MKLLLILLSLCFIASVLAEEIPPKNTLELFHSTPSKILPTEPVLRAYSVHRVYSPFEENVNDYIEIFSPKSENAKWIVEIGSDINKSDIDIRFLK